MNAETKPAPAPVKSVWVVSVYLLVAAAASAQNYSIDWYKVSGGGGTSTGGVYAISGTIGQPDAGVMSGGNYALQGGFWSIIQAVQTEGAPTLEILYSSPATVTVSWALSPGYYLEESTTLTGTPWAQVAPATYHTNAGIVSITAPIQPGSLFYRLHKQ